MIIHTKFQVNIRGELPEDFKQALRVILRSTTGESFNYKGTFFIYDPQNVHAPVHTLIEGIAERVPEVFAQVPLQRIRLIVTELPDPLTPKPGWYFKDTPEGRVGSRTVGIVVDPKGVSYHGVPTIVANGRQLDAIIAFFKEVMTGTIEPSNPHLT